MDADTPLDVEYILGGREASVIKILVLDANITLKYIFGSQLGSIITNTGADKILSPFKLYTFTYYNGVWYEDA